MTHANNTVQALTRLSFFSKREMIELPRLLLPDERILVVISGIYTAGTAILCVTSRRILLVDKKLLRSSFEDIRFESIKEVNFSQQALMASIRFFYAGREMQFRSWHKKELRILAQMVQQKMFEAHERLHAKELPVISQPPTEIYKQQIEKGFPSILQQQSALQLDTYLSERLDRWKKASRFAGALSMSVKTGRQVLKFETSQG